MRAHLVGPQAEHDLVPASRKSSVAGIGSNEGSPRTSAPLRAEHAAPLTRKVDLGPAGAQSRRQDMHEWPRSRQQIDDDELDDADDDAHGKWARVSQARECRNERGKADDNPNLELERQQLIHQTPM